MSDEFGQTTSGVPNGRTPEDITRINTTSYTGTEVKYVDLKNLYPSTLGDGASHADLFPQKFAYFLNDGNTEYIAYANIAEQNEVFYIYQSDSTLVGSSPHVLCVKVENIQQAREKVLRSPVDANEGRLPCLSLGEPTGSGFLVWMGQINEVAVGDGDGDERTKIMSQDLDGKRFISPTVTYLFE